MDSLVAGTLKLLLFILPAYFANSSPVVFGGGAPLDLNARFSDGRRVLGNGKTIRGFVTGILAGGIIGGVLGLILPGTSLSFLPDFKSYLLLGFVLGFGTMLGDSIGSFVKRRLDIKPGHPSFLLDQLTFLVVALLLAYPMVPSVYSVPALVFLFVVTYFLHIGFNVLANRLGLKRVPW